MEEEQSHSQEEVLIFRDYELYPIKTEGYYVWSYNRDKNKLDGFKGSP